MAIRGLTHGVVSMILLLALAGSGKAQQPGQPAGAAPGSSTDRPMAVGEGRERRREHRSERHERGAERARDDADDDDASDDARPRMPRMHGMMGHGMMGHGMMIQQHLERVAQQLELSDEQRAQVQPIVRGHIKEIIRLRAELETLGIDLQTLIDAEPVDLAKVKPQLQAIAGKEAELRLVHITAMQDVRKLLTPEQRQKFRMLQHHTMGDGGMMGHGGMQQRGGMGGRGARGR